MLLSFLKLFYTCITGDVQNSKLIPLFDIVLSILIKHEYRYFIALIWSVKKITIFAGTQNRILSAYRPASLHAASLKQ